MSAAAVEAAATTIARLALKGSKRALLETIAKLIPDTRTTTMPISLDDLALLTRYDRRTIQIAGDALAAIEAVRIDGGRGRLATYELLALPGAGVADPVLPLLGRPRVPTPRVSPPSAPTVFDPPAVAIDAPPARPIRAYTVRSFFVCCLTNVRSFFVGWRANIRSFFLPSRTADGIDDARARASTYTPRTHAAEAANATQGPPPHPWGRAHPWHAWCAGPVHVPRDLHDEFRRKLQLTDDALFAIYGVECDALTPGDPILENDYTFWRRRFAIRFVGPPLERAPQTRARDRPPRRDIEVRRPCPHAPPCVDDEACIDRSVTEWRTKQERKSG
jgi:hypothetical protein